MSTLLTTAERARERPLDIEEFIAREGIGGDEAERRRGARAGGWLTSSSTRSRRAARRSTRWPRAWRPSSRRRSARSTWPCTTCACPARRAIWWPARCATPPHAGWPSGSPTTPTTTSGMVPPPPSTAPELIEALPFPTAGIPGIPDLMHHKYVVRDGEAVWTGSTNWTTDSWTLQENLVTVARSADAGGRVHRQLRGALEHARREPHRPRPSRGRAQVGGHPARAWFTPGHGEDLSHRIAAAIGRARRRVRIASPVITAGPGDRHARRGGGRGAGGPARRGGPHADERGLPAVAREPALGLEGADRRRRSCARPTSAASPPRATRPTVPTTSCTPRSRWPTTWSSPARSTSRARAR